MKRQVILHITPFFSPNIGGVETHLSDLTTELDKLGYINIVLTYSPVSTPHVAWKSKESIGKHISICRFSWFGFNLFHRLEKYPLLSFIYITPYLLFRSIFWILFHPESISTIHSHGVNGAVIGIVLKKIFKIRNHIVSIYSTYDNVPINNTSNKLLTTILNSTDKVLTQSQQSVKQLTTMGVRPEKIDLYRHWIDFHKFHPMNKTKLRHKFNIDNKFCALFIGRMIPPKGALLLAKVAMKLPEINFLFVGQGPDYPKLHKLSQQWKNIILFGNVPYEQLNLYYNLADVFCIPSLYNEGWGRVIMEALACGLPVVASNRGAIPEVVDNTVSIMVNPTTKNLFFAIKKLYTNKTLFNKMKHNSTKYAHLKFSTRSIELITKYYV